MDEDKVIEVFPGLYRTESQLRRGALISTSLTAMEEISSLALQVTGAIRAGATAEEADDSRWEFADAGHALDALGRRLDEALSAVADLYEGAWMHQVTEPAGPEQP